LSINDSTAFDKILVLPALVPLVHLLDCAFVRPITERDAPVVSVVSDFEGIQAIGVLVDLKDEVACISRIFGNAVLSLIIFDSSIEIVLINAVDTGETEPG
jgi:hypothetical protein